MRAHGLGRTPRAGRESGPPLGQGYLCRAWGALRPTTRGVLLAGVQEGSLVWEAAGSSHPTQARPTGELWLGYSTPIHGQKIQRIIGWEGQLSLTSVPSTERCGSSEWTWFCRTRELAVVGELCWEGCVGGGLTQDRLWRWPDCWVQDRTQGEGAEASSPGKPPTGLPQLPCWGTGSLSREILDLQ